MDGFVTALHTSLPNAGTVFNSDGSTTNASFDSRSDNKAIEPEAVEIGQIGDKTYAFVGLERQGGVMVYDVTNPEAPSYVKYLAPTSTDRGPEILKFIPAAESANGKNMLLTANEYSGTVTSYEIEAPTETFRLQILHASDFEAGLDAVDRAGNFAAIVDYLEDTQENSITLSSGDNFLPSPFFAAGSDASLKEVYETALEDYYNLAPGTLNITPGFGTADISMLNIIGIQASAIGNHEFDAGTNPFAAIIRQTAVNGGANYPGAQFPYLAANLDFSGDANLNPLYSGTIRDAADYGGFPPAVGVGSANKKIAPATIITENGEKIGVVGATTQIVQSISSTGGVEVIGPNANDMAALAAVIQPTIDALIAQGIDKIVLVSHLQELALEKALAPLLHGVDIIVAGGSHTLLADSEDVSRGLQPGDTAVDTYPLVTQNADGKTTVIVNTDNEYSYVGRLVVDFDANGDVIADSIDPNVSGAFATTDDQVGALYDNPIDIDGDGDLDSDPFASGTRGDLVNDIAQGVGAVIDQQDGNLFGKTDVYLEGRRGEVRTEETNLGNLSADANLWYAQKADDTVLVSIKNGGGIRDSIGRVQAVGGDSNELPPEANPGVGKQEGDVSQLDIANSLRFNNALSLITLTPEQLLLVLKHAVRANAPGATPGQFAQIGGISYSYDADLPASQRVVSAALIDENGDATRVLVKDGEVVADAPSAIRVVTLSFLVTGGDGYPFPSFVSANSGFANVVNLNAENVPDAGQVANFANEGTEQDALAEYLDALYSDTPYDVRDTTRANDTRIQNLDFRDDTVFEGADLTPAVGTTGSDRIVGTAGNDTLLGLDGNDTLLGRSGDDTLDGGKGADAMTGGSGDDTFVVDSGRDTVFESAGGGADTVITTVSYTLAAGQEIETLRIASSTGTAGLRITGNEFDNALIANAGANRIDGGAGADLMQGLQGNDTYTVDDEGDVVLEGQREGGGVDTVLSSVDFTLSDNVERLTLTGAADIDGTGNALINRLVGNAGDNVLAGGFGNDTLTGGAGADTFVFDTTPGTGNVDRITDFRVGQDVIALENTIFRGLGTGALSQDAFKDITDGAVVDATDRILYNHDTGRLYYDADGNGSGVRVQVAILEQGPTLTFQDFLAI